MTGVAARRRGRPSLEEQVVDRDEVLRLALRAFAVHGYDGMSLRALSRDIGGSPALIQRHFGSKDGLWKSAVDHSLVVVRQFLADFEKAHVGAPATSENARQAVRFALRVSAHNPDLVRITLEEGARGGDRLAYLWENYLEPFNSLWMSIVSGIGLPEEDRNPNDQRTMFFLSTIGSAAPFMASNLSDLMDGDDIRSDAIFERHIDLLTELIMLRLGI